MKLLVILKENIFLMSHYLSKHSLANQ